MTLRLVRRWFTPLSTIGDLSVDGVPECYILEDVVRPNGIKIPGRTAIPTGTYRVIIDRSSRFQRDLPLLLDVPGFTGIRIHPGNTDRDTDGCLLPGRSRSFDAVQQSRSAFDALYTHLRWAWESGQRIEIEITEEQRP